MIHCDCDWVTLLQLTLWHSVLNTGAAGLWFAHHLHPRLNPLLYSVSTSQILEHAVGNLVANFNYALPSQINDIDLLLRRRTSRLRECVYLRWTNGWLSQRVILLCFSAELHLRMCYKGQCRWRQDSIQVSLLHALSSWIICLLLCFGSVEHNISCACSQYRWTTGSNSPAWKPSLANYKLWLCSIWWETLKSIPHRTDVWTDSWCQHADADLTSSQSVWLTSIHGN